MIFRLIPGSAMPRMKSCACRVIMTGMDGIPRSMMGPGRKAGASRGHGMEISADLSPGEMLRSPWSGWTCGRSSVAWAASTGRIRPRLPRGRASAR